GGANYKEEWCFRLPKGNSLASPHPKSSPQGERELEGPGQSSSSSPASAAARAGGSAETKARVSLSSPPSLPSETFATPPLPSGPKRMASARGRLSSVWITRAIERAP